MRYMTWDSELAWIAEKYSKTCTGGHNPNRNTHSTFTSVGENIWSSTGRVSSYNGTNVVKAWHSEISRFDYATRTCEAGKACGHYTQIVWADTYKIGCALSQCEDTSINTGWRNTLKLLCNYAPAGNVYMGGKMMLLYEVGSPCAKCGEGDYCRNSLCANSARDFIDEPETPEPPIDHTSGLTGALVFFVLLSILLIALILFRERERLRRVWGDFRGKTAGTGDRTMQNPDTRQTNNKI